MLQTRPCLETNQTQKRVKRVVLTGCNGFLGSHILSELLAKDFPVRGIVRSQARADQVRKYNPSTGKNLEFGIVPDITTPGAFNEVIKADPPIDVVLHQASPFLFKVTDDNERDFLVPAVKGTEEILKAIKAYAPSVRRVVLTSSCAAVLDWKAGDDGKIYTEEDWNPTTWEEAVNGDKGEPYRGSKKYAEKAGKSDCIVKFLLCRRNFDYCSSLGFRRERKSKIELVVLCPPMIYGPLSHTIASTEDLNQSNNRIYQGFVKSSKDEGLLPNGLYSTYLSMLGISQLPMSKQRW